MDTAILLCLSSMEGIVVGEITSYCRRDQLSIAVALLFSGTSGKRIETQNGPVEQNPKQTTFAIASL